MTTDLNDIIDAEFAHQDVAQWDDAEQYNDDLEGLI